VSRWVSAARLEITTVVRQRFVHAAVFSGLLWLAVLLPMPIDVRRIVEPYVLVGDITIIGFYFIGGSVFFEKQERTLGAVICSPLRLWEYLSAKIAVLLMISLCIALLVVGVAHGGNFRSLPLVAGVTLGTLVMLLAGFASSLPFDSVSDWFLSTTVPLAILALPVLDLSGVWVSPVLYVIPTQGPLLLFAATFDQLTLTPWQLAYALLYPLACAAGLYRLAKMLFDRYVIARSGVL
jgi:fluoroquinolone transport system permease protein